MASAAEPGGAEFSLLVADTGTNVTAYVDLTATEPGVRYTYRVKAIRGGERSGWSRYATTLVEAPEPSSRLVGNLRQGGAVRAEITKQHATGFRLGSHGQGYEISSVLIDLAAAPTTLTASLWISGHPEHIAGGLHVGGAPQRNCSTSRARPRSRPA